MGMRNAGGRAIPTLEKSCSRGGKAGKHDDEEREERRGSRRRAMPQEDLSRVG